MKWLPSKGSRQSSEESFNVSVQTPGSKRRKTLITCLKWFLIVLLIIAILGFIGAFVVFPLVFMSSLSIQTYIMFPNTLQPKNPEYNNFAKYGAEGVRNIYVNVRDFEDNSTIALGVWHVLPEELREAAQEGKIDFDEALRSEEHDVIIYHHGNSGTRILPLPTYEILRKYFHVIAMDYRSYGDSTQAKLTEEGVVNDLRQFYKWVRTKTNAKIYVWGHSLGTALSTHAMALLDSEGITPMGLILEAPFTTMREEVPVHPLGKIFAWLAWFEATFLDPLEENGFHFKTSTNILSVDCPIMILHAEDDSIIPYTLGKKLADIATNERNLTSQGNVTYHQFHAKFRYNHVEINNAPELPGYLEEFKEICKAYNLGKG